MSTISESRLILHQFAAATHGEVATALPRILFVPAMGVPARFYEPFLSRLLARGVAASACTLELPGQGAHPSRARRGDDYGYREVVEVLIPGAVQHLEDAMPTHPIVLIGHSLGAQLAVLASAELASRVERFVLIAAGTAHWRRWPQAHRLRAAATIYAIATAAAVLPWYPGVRLGFGGDQSRRFMRDWSFNARSGRYRLSGSTTSPQELEQRLARVMTRVHLLGIDGDRVAPTGASDELLAFLPQARLTRQTVTGVATDGPWRRHFSWARHASDLDHAVASQLAEVHCTR